MKLEFTILWIDDSDTWVESVRDVLSSIIEDRGLIPKIIVEHSISDSKKHLKSNCDVFDLILVDFRLGENKDTNEQEFGDELIRLIRDNQIYSNIIFYSTDENSLRRIRSDAKLQGVYIFSRGELEIGNLDDSLVPLIDFLIKRDLDVASLRGISTSTVAYFDEQFKTIIEKYIPCKNIIDKINKKAEEKNKKRRDVVEQIKQTYNIEQSLKDNQIASEELKDTLLSTKFLDSSARYECVKNYLKNHVIPELRSEDLNNYVEDIIKKRNKLAHTFEENSFTEKQKIEILKCLSRYKKLFDKF